MRSPRAAYTTEDLVALFERIHEIVNQLLPAENFFVALHDAERDEISFPYHADQYGREPTPQVLESGVLSGEVIRTGRPLLLTSDPADPARAALSEILGRRSLDWLGVPLESGAGVLGALVVQSYSGDVHYTEDDKALLQFVSTQIGAAVERKRTHDRLRYMAQYDQLTGLPNRTLFQDRLQSALARAWRNGGRLAVLLLDMDKFKEVNDTFGHSAGDHLLRDVAIRLQGSVRASDTVARLGGDEFVVLIDNIGKAEDAAIVADKILANLSRPYELHGRTLRILPSIGVAVYPDDGADNEQLLRRADAAMYSAKRGGADPGGVRRHGA